MIDVLTQAGSRWLSLVWPIMWQGSAVALIALVLLPLARRVSPSLALGLLGVALLKFFIPPVAASPMALVDASVAAIRPEGRIEGDALAGAVLAILHVIGIGWMSVRLWRRHRWLSHAIALSEPIERTDLTAARDRLARVLGLRRVPELRVSALVETPLAAGVARPVVLLPRSSLAIDPDRLGLVIAHELAHHRAGDLWFEWVVAGATTVWWFNPVVWMLAGQIREVREDRCDDRVVGLGIDPQTYCRVLLDVAAARLTSPALAIRDVRHPLARRFARLLARRTAVTIRRLLTVPMTLVFATLALPHSSWSPWDRQDEGAIEVVEQVRVVIEQRVVR